MQVEGSYEGEIRIVFHEIPIVFLCTQYTVVVNSSLTLTVFAFNWPVPDHHSIYSEQKCSVQYVDIIELLQRIEKSKLCEGLQSFVNPINTWTPA